MKLPSRALDQCLGRWKFLVILPAVFGCALESGQTAPERQTAPVLRTVSPVVDVAARVAELGKLSSDERGQYCSSSTDWIPMERQIKIFGALRFQNANSQLFLNALNKQISAYFYSPAENYARLKETLRAASELQAFTELTQYRPAELPSSYNGWNEPAFQQAILLVPVSISYLILRKEEPENSSLQASVKRWGDAIFSSASSGKDDFRGTFMGLDRRSLKASGYAFWGNATSNSSALAMALDDYKAVLRTIRSSGADSVWGPQGELQPYYVNLTLAPMTLTAYALNRSGVNDPYSMTNGGGSLLQGVSWLMQELTSRSDPIGATGITEGSRGIAWLEQLVRDNAEDRLSAPIMNAWKNLSPPLYIALAGGPVTCLFRKVQQR